MFHNIHAQGSKHVMYIYRHNVVDQVGRSSGGHGSWMIQREEDYDYWMAKIRDSMPHADTILTEMIPDIKRDLCCHFYLSRSGDVMTLAVTEQIIDKDVFWIGAVLQVGKTLFI